MITLHTGAMPETSPGTFEVATIVIDNRGDDPIELDWVDFEGRLTRYSSLEPGTSLTQSTFVGHVWAVSRNGRRLGWFAAPAGRGKLVLP